MPRAVFPPLDSLPRSYYLGHHAAGLAKMNSMLSQIDLIIECRDYRVPLTSRNPLFEHSLAGRERLVVYTKRDLGSNAKPIDAQVCSIVDFDSRYYPDADTINRGKPSFVIGIDPRRCCSRTTKIAGMFAAYWTLQKTIRQEARH